MKLKLKRQQHWSCCPYCTKPVGLLGRGLAKLFGTNMHQCDFSNVDYEAHGATAAQVNSNHSDGTMAILDLVEREVLKERARCLTHLRNVSWSYPEAVSVAVNNIEEGVPADD